VQFVAVVYLFLAFTRCGLLLTFVVVRFVTLLRCRSVCTLRVLRCCLCRLLFSVLPLIVLIAFVYALRFAPLLVVTLLNVLVAFCLAVWIVLDLPSRCFLVAFAFRLRYADLTLVLRLLPLFLRGYCSTPGCTHARIPSVVRLRLLVALRCPFTRCCPILLCSVVVYAFISFGCSVAVTLLDRRFVAFVTALALPDCRVVICGAGIHVTWLRLPAFVPLVTAAVAFVGLYVPLRCSLFWTVGWFGLFRPVIAFGRLLLTLSRCYV